jgi:hypothetical protein
VNLVAFKTLVEPFIKLIFHICSYLQHYVHMMSAMFNSYSCLLFLFFLFLANTLCYILDLTVSLSILSRFWKRQLVVAKDARRVDSLCSRIYLSHRLLDGTTRFKELHRIVEDAKAKLESEVGPLDGTSSKMARGIVGRLPVAADVQQLCSLAIEKADEWLSSNIQSETKQNGKLFLSCKVYIFHFHSAIDKFDKPSVILFVLQIHFLLPAGLNLKILQLHLWCWFSRKLFPRSIMLSKAINSGTGIAEKRLTQGSLLFSPKTKEGF